VPHRSRDSTKCRKSSPHRNHSDLPKFASVEEADFGLVISCISDCLDDSEAAPERYDQFFKHRGGRAIFVFLDHDLLTRLDSLRNSSEHLARAEQRSRDSWNALRPKLARVSSSDSQKNNRESIEINLEHLNDCEHSNGLCGLTTLRILQKVADDEFGL
jgi:hypothetical protein